MAEVFKLGQRVHFAGNPCRVGTVKYAGSVQGYQGTLIGVDWDDEDAKHDGSVNGVQYFQAKSAKSASFVRFHNLSSGITLIDAFHLRYKAASSTQQDNDERYVLSASNRRVSVQLLGEDKIQEKLGRLEELKSASVSYLGVSSVGDTHTIGSILPNLEELDMRGNLLDDWKDIFLLCEQLPALATLNLTSNLMRDGLCELSQLKHLRVLVLNGTRVNWTQVELLEESLPVIEEMHLMGNMISQIKCAKSSNVKGFNFLRFLNLEDNSIAEWDEIVKFSWLRSLEKLHLNKNHLKQIFYPAADLVHGIPNHLEHDNECSIPFQKLKCLLLGGNQIEDVASIDCLNHFPQLADVRLSENPVTDPGRGGIPRFVQVARLANAQVLNGSEVSPRERKESEIRYVRLVMSKYTADAEDVQRLEPRFQELKHLYGIEDGRSSTGPAVPKKMASGLISITLRCVGPSICDKPHQTKKLPATITVGKLKHLCETFFKLKSIRPRLYFHGEGSPLPTLLDDEMASFIDLGIGSDSVILVDEDC